MVARREGRTEQRGNVCASTKKRFAKKKCSRNIRGNSGLPHSPKDGASLFLCGDLQIDLWSQSLSH